MPADGMSLESRILEARTVGGVPPSEPMLPCHDIGELLERQADRFEQKPFLIYYADGGQRREYSYREFYEEACKTANYLRSAGIGPGDRVATVSANHADVVVQHFAAFLLGVSVVPVNIDEDDRRISYILLSSAAKLAFVRDQFVERIARLLPRTPMLKTIVQTGTRIQPSLPHFETEIARHDARLRSSRRPEPDDEALLVYTSGTTGQPKGVVLTHYNLLVEAMHIAEWHRISDDQKLMSVLPLHHVSGLVSTVMTPLFVGAGTVVNHRFQADRFFERISFEKVSVVSVVPSVLQFLLHARLPMEAYKLAQLHHIICGAAPLTVELVQRFEQTFKIPVMHAYGLSETTSAACCLPIDLPPQEHKLWLSRHGFPSIGVPLGLNEMTIHDGEGRELQEGTRGEIVIRGHNVMKQYLDDPQANDIAFAHGWFRSGDEGFFLYDEEGRKFFFITGRIKEIIIRGGVNISPFEIEEVLMQIPGIRAGLAIGFDNEWYGEEVGAYVVLKDGIELTGEHIIAHCRKQMPFPKSPKVVVFGEEIHLSSTGEHQRSKCRDLFARWKEVQFKEEQ